MQDNLKKTQDELERLRVVGKSGGGMVAVEMNGRHDVINVTINPVTIIRLHSFACRIVCIFFY
jgi:DNA-binding protein YbaB